MTAAKQLELSAGDQQMLCGAQGPSLEFAMGMLVCVADCMGASRLIDITQAHLVGSYYGGPGDMALIEKLAGNGARVAVPTTLNASSADLYQHNLYDPERSDVKASCRIVKCYQDMGCQVELTCAPYHLPSLPAQGECIAWAESNAIVYANSVIGARTNKTFQYLDLCAALTGRIPEFGYYCSDNRLATQVYELCDIPPHWLGNDVFYQLLGLCLGQKTGSAVPVIDGLSPSVTEDQLRGLGAAAASSGSLTMFHAVGLTPEAPSLAAALGPHAPKTVDVISARDIVRAKDSLCFGKGGRLSAICLGTPHFSLAEFQTVLSVFNGGMVASGIDFYISTSRHVFEQLRHESLLEPLSAAGISVVTDTCTYHGLLLKNRPGVVMTTSAKWAYYAPGNLNVDVVFATLDDCMLSAIRGQVFTDETFWQF